MLKKKKHHPNFLTFILEEHYYLFTLFIDVVKDKGGIFYLKIKCKKTYLALK